MKGSSAIAHILKKEGVDHLFCFPVNPLIDAAAELGIRPIMPCTERTVIGMADGYSRVNNGKRIGVCAVQQGPGVENTFGGVAQAFSDSSPVLVFPGGPPQSRQASLPTFDPVPSFQHVAKWAARINQPPRIPEFLRRAFTYLRMGRPGPVVLELPQDVALADLEDPTQSYKGVQASRALADPQNIKAALKAILAAKNPLLHAGLGVLYSEAWGELREFAELMQIPVMTTLPGKSCFPENHPLSLGCGGLSGSKVVAQFLSECDLIFAIGSSMSISYFAAPIPPGKAAIQLTIDERDLNKDYPVDIPLMGDVKLTLGEMIEEVKRRVGKDGKKGDDAVARKIKAAREGWLNEWMPLLTSDEVPVNPYRVIWDAQKALDLSSTIATHDAGNPRDQTAPLVARRKSQQLHRVGEIHPPGIQPSPGPGGQSGDAAENGRPHHGGWRLRDERDGHCHRGAEQNRHLDDPPEQLLPGRIREAYPHRHKTVRDKIPRRRLLQSGRRAGGLCRADRSSQGYHPGRPAGSRENKDRKARGAGSDNQRRKPPSQVLVIT